MVRKDACLFSAEIGKSYIQNMSFMYLQYKYNILEICIERVVEEMDAKQARLFSLMDFGKFMDNR
jgi:hypothetical protein